MILCCPLIHPVAELLGPHIHRRATGRGHSEEESIEHLLCEIFHLLQMIQVALKEKFFGFFFFLVERYSCFYQESIQGLIYPSSIGWNMDWGIW